MYNKDTERGVVKTTPLFVKKRGEKMSTSEKLREVLEPIAKQHDITIVDIRFLSGGLIEIPIMKADKTMDLDTSSMMGELFADALEHVEGMDYDYMLDVCSPGAERVLNSQQEIEDEIGNHVYVKMKNPKAGFFEIYGDLDEATAESITIGYMDKTRKKRFDVDTDNIEIIRLAIKL